ncbi:MAG: glycosyl hydrolase 2 galactose-binding domain-containing protein, partial [Pyrinomonadaceae bacterium]
MHTDLLNNGLIEDPFYRDNEKKLQWIDKVDWEYQTNFDVTPQLLAKRNVELVFEGLDTYANVFLNGAAEIISSDDLTATLIVMNSRNCNAPIEKKVRLRPGSNEVSLDINIPSPKLWWPSGLGRQSLYTFDARLVIDGRMADQISTRTGLRSLQLKQQT